MNFKKLMLVTLCFGPFASHATNTVTDNQDRIPLARRLFPVTPQQVEEGNAWMAQQKQKLEEKHKAFPERYKIIKNISN